MAPNERWDDFAIDKEFQRIDREFDRIGNVLEVTALLPNQMVKLTGAVDANTQRIASHHDWIEAVEKRTESRLSEVKALCERVGQDLREDIQDRARNRAEDLRERGRNRIQLVIAIIGAASIVAAAIITAPH